MQGSERDSAADWEWASGEGSGVSAKRRSRRRWSAEEKARIVRESFWPGKRVEDVAQREPEKPRHPFLSALAATERTMR